MKGPLGETHGKGGVPELEAVKELTVVALESELRRRGVLGLHISLTGQRASITAVTSDDAIAIGGLGLETAFLVLLTQLPGCGHA